jgi:uncharacterized RDD family membrane protein YckC
VTAYPFPAASPAPPTATTADPTAVVGRRIGGFVIDLLLYILVMAFVGPTPLSPLAEYYEVPEGVSNPCDAVDDDNDVASCVEIGDRVYFTTNGDVAVQIVTSLAFVGLYAALQGATGRTPGKAVFGLKVVNEQGRNPGFGRGLVRTLLWIVDGQPCGIPLVGFITGLTTKGHRRVGDMAAKTFVVDKAHSGPVVVPGLTTAATSPYGAPGGPGAPGAPGAPWGAPPAGAGTPAWGAPPQPQAPWGGPPSGGFPPPGAGGPPAGGAAPSGAPTAPPARAVPRPAPPSSTPAGRGAAHGPPTGGAGAAPSGETAATAGAPIDRPAAGERPTPATPAPTPAPQPAAQPAPQPAAQPAATGYNPQWDAARGTYIVWEPQRGQWLGWDDATKQWRPL